MAKEIPSSAVLMIIAGCFTIFAAIITAREAQQTTVTFRKVEKKK